MGNRIKRCKVLIYALIAALILPMEISNHQVYAATTGTETDEEDAITPSVIVSSYEELAQAIEEAEDGDVIGIDRLISIYHDADYLGAADKHITILKMANNAYFQIAQSERLIVRNITFDGNRGEYNIRNDNPMLSVNSSLILQNVTIQNCYSQSGGAGLCVYDGVVNINNCIMKENRAMDGGHIKLYNTAIVNIRNTELTKGESSNEGGAIFVCSEAATVNLVSSKIYGNQTVNMGGGIKNHGKLFIEDTVIYGNTAQYGADIANICQISD